MADSDPLINMASGFHPDSDRLSPLSSVGDCPSLTDSFASSQPSGTDIDGTRRSSFLSFACDSPYWYSLKSARTTSPPIPVTAMPFFGTEDQCMKMGQVPDGGSLYHTAEMGIPELDFWMSNAEADNLGFGNMTAISLKNVLGASEQSFFSSSYSHYPQTVGMSNPALSQSIFEIHDTVDSGADLELEEQGLNWPCLPSSPPQTIAPGAAFQPILFSSPVMKHEPLTPIRSSPQSSMMFSSSPMSLLSPPVVPSQHEFEEIKYDIADHDILGAELKRQRNDVDRLHRRGYERKRNVGRSNRPKPPSGRSGMQCDVVIEKNEFACSYPGCIDKTTGNQKRFKRQEHKKRHEKTVHEKDNNPVHRCWVPGCKTAPFSRTDNLKSHLKNTHGKKSPNQRNLYVATQDKHSEYFDLDYVGELTKEGYPVLS